MKLLPLVVAIPWSGKYNETVPFNSGYTYADQKDARDAVDAVLDKETGSFNSFDNDGDIQNWVSVFGTNNPDAPLPSDAGSLNNSEDPDETYYQNGIVTPKVGAEEFLDGFGGAPIKSPFQDGHYIYTVIAGSGSGTSSIRLSFMWLILKVQDLSTRICNHNLITNLNN